MKKPILLGLVGKAGSGKSTAARHLVDKYGAMCFSFAGPLKVMAKELFELTDEQLYGTQAQKGTIDPRYGRSPRKLMQQLGDSTRRTFGNDVWVRLCFREIERHTYYFPPGGPSLFLIEDVREPHEAAAIVHATGHTGRLLHLSGAAHQHGSDDEANHKSETGVDDIPAGLIHFYVRSERTPGSVDLKRKLDAVMSSILSGTL